MHQGKGENEGREEEGGPQHDLMCPDLGVESGHVVAYASALTYTTPSYARPSAMVNNTTRVSGGVALPRRQLTSRRAADLGIML
jgi:hypothetical protein